MMGMGWTRELNDQDAQALLARQAAKTGRAVTTKPAKKATKIPKAPRGRSKGEIKLEEQILALGCPEPVAEYAPGLHLPKPRKHRFDFAWPHHIVMLPDFDLAWGDFGVRRLAAEVNGGCHKTEERFQSDVRKMNLYQPMGWLILSYPTEMIMSGEAIEHLKPFLWALREA